ncbi:MAG: hypothetical protein JXP34_16235 [Planctomycetes bacterium]|nr:hypothetical protein [Planctomycetota bacterium]
MLRTNENYLKILTIELEDLREDLEALIERCAAEREAGRLSPYVCLENLALFKNELLGVDAFGRIVRETDPSAFAALEAMIDHLRHRFRALARDAGFADAVHICIDRKLAKVAKYCCP